MADEPIRLSPSVEEMLKANALPERDWEADAQAIEARLKDVSAGSTEARWLEAPLPDEPPAEAGDTSRSMTTSTDGDESTTQAEPKQPSKPPPAGLSATATPGPKSAPSLADLARSVAAKNSRPQATDIAKESLSVAAAARSHTDAIVERVRSSRAASPRVAAPPAPSSQRPPADSARSAPARPRPRPAPPPPSASAERRSSQALPWIAAAGLGVVVVVLLVGKLKEPEAPVAAIPAAAEPAPAAQALPTNAPAAAPAPQVEAAARPSDAKQPRADAVPERDASELPLAAAHATPASAPASGPHGAKPAGQAQALAAAAPAAPPASRPAPEAIVLEESKPKGAAATNSGLKPAAGSSAGGLPDRPSSGAVQAAIGSVMGGARACVAGGTAATPAQVTFGSDGVVKSVSVSGAAAGTPAASCIESSLKRARVAPFASQSFTLMVWVRP